MWPVTALPGSLHKKMYGHKLATSRPTGTKISSRDNNAVPTIRLAEEQKKQQKHKTADLPTPAQIQEIIVLLVCWQLSVRQPY